MDETSKSKATWGELEWGILRGSGIDIGCGPDPVTATARRFDRAQGDANHITRHVAETFDYVYSSHCLEHMADPRAALAEWWTLVKPGGHLFFAVPDEDLYEQGFFPSLFNPDHKATFTIHKKTSWSPVSYNVRELVAALPGAEIVLLEVQDRGYDHGVVCPHTRRPGWFRHKLYSAYAVLTTMLGVRFFDRWVCRFHPIDQTRRPGTLAQIRCIVKKAG
jgi:SAM-dependent methyltransferase